MIPNPLHLTSGFIAQVGTSNTVGWWSTIIIPPKLAGNIALWECVVTTDANVANRRARLIYDLADGPFTLALSPAIQTASTTCAYMIGTHGALSPSTDTGVIYMPLPAHLYITPHDVLYLTLDNIQAGDSFATTRALCHLWHSNV